MRFGYADPPYFKCCALYGHHHPDGLCWDDAETHRLLIVRLDDEHPDGWALSCSTPSLRTILPMCPDDVRIAAWVKTFCAFKKGVRPCYSWEPVIFRGGRNKGHKPPEKGGKQNTPKDFVILELLDPQVLAAPITLKKGLTGAKPEPFCEWVCDLLNVLPGDEVVDLFPGTGIMGRVAERRVRTPITPSSRVDVLGEIYEDRP